MSASLCVQVPALPALVVHLADKKPGQNERDDEHRSGNPDIEKDISDPGHVLFDGVAALLGNSVEVAAKLVQETAAGQAFDGFDYAVAFRGIVPGCFEQSVEIQGSLA
jgi:hypothetical protein